MTDYPDIYQPREGITLYRGDCLDILPTLTGVEAVITDPPYGIGWDTDYTRFSSGFNVPGTAHKAIHSDEEKFDPRPFLMGLPTVLFGANFYADALPVGTWLVWDKRFPNGKAFLSDAELAWMRGGKGVYIYSETSQGFVRSEPIQHPTQKPVGVMAWCMERAKVASAALVLDPFMGSGTTGIACIRTGRRFIGIEIDPAHYATACRRIDNELQQMTLPIVSPQ